MDGQDSPRETLIHQSANRPHLILGGDRELVLFAGLTAVCLAFTLATWWGVCIGIIFWLAAVAVLARMGKADPLLRHVYLRHIRYKAFYPAKSACAVVALPCKNDWR
jgi:type IV secretory pathway TrbD component